MDDCKLRIHDDRWAITAVDPANVGMVNVTIHADAFDAYDVHGETPIEIGLPLADLRGQLRNARLGTRTNDPIGLSSPSHQRDRHTRRNYLRVRPNDRRAG